MTSTSATIRVPHSWSGERYCNGRTISTGSGRVAGSRGGIRRTVGGGPLDSRAGGSRCASASASKATVGACGVTRRDPFARGSGRSPSGRSTSAASVGAGSAGGGDASAVGGDESAVADGDASTVGEGDESTVGEGDASTVGEGDASAVAGGDESAAGGGAAARRATWAPGRAAAARRRSA